jgi:hypothetical protein
MDIDPKDAAVLSALTNAGSDVRLPHALRHYFYATQLAIAAALKDRLRSSGYGPTTDEAAGMPGEHLVLVITAVIPTPSEIARLRFDFEKIAKEVGAEYDGWEAPITKGAG